MAPHPRYQRSLEELFLHVYVYIDDWLEPYQAQLPKHCKQKASISELLTIAVVGELLAQPFESTWYWLVQQSFVTVLLQTSLQAAMRGFTASVSVAQGVS